MAIAPQSFSGAGLKAKLALEWKGDVSLPEKMLAHVPAGIDPEGVVTTSRINLFILQRKFPEALQLIQGQKEEIIHGDGPSPIPKAYLEGVVYWFMNDKEHARASFERARAYMEQSVRESPDDPTRHAQLGATYAGLGRKDDAIREGRRAVELLPESKDAFEGPQTTVALAQIYAWTGENDQALQLLDHLLNTPNGITVALIRIDPVWDPLRKDPRFQALIDKYSAKT